MNYETIIFDLDGTLLYTIEDLTDSVNHIMKKYGYAERSIDEVTSFVGNGLTRLLELSLPFGKLTPDFELLDCEFKTYYSEHSCIKTKPYLGIEDALKQLKNSGIKMAIVTNKTQKAAQYLHDKFFGEYIEFTLGDSPERKRKPAPDGVIQAMSLLNAKPESCLYIGDSEVDKKTADNANLPVALVSWGFRGKDFITQLKPQYVFETPWEMAQLNDKGILSRGRPLL